MSKVVNIKGKNYRMVQDRVKEFRSSPIYKEHRIETQMLHFDGSYLILKASILNSDGKILSDGIAGEKVGSSQINTTSFVENCQTSAIGRALAFLDENLMGDSLPSADELSGAIKNQDILNAKLDAVVSILKSVKNEEQLKTIWEQNSPIWKEEFGEHFFKPIEKAKNELKQIFKKYSEKNEVPLVA